VTTPLFLQSKLEGASHVCKCLCFLFSSMVMGFFTFDKYISLNSSLLKSANLFSPTLCSKPDFLFPFFSIIYFKFLLKFPILLSASSACLYTFWCFSFHSLKTSVMPSSVRPSWRSLLTAEYSPGRPEERHASGARSKNMKRVSCGFWDSIYQKLGCHWFLEQSTFWFIQLKPGKRVPN